MIHRNSGVIIGTRSSPRIYSQVINPIARINSLPNDSFSPTELTNLVLWLRADLGVTLISGKVSSWDDQSGLGNHVTQSVSGSRPNLGLLQNGNNREAVHFTSSNSQFLGRPFTGLPMSSSITAFVVRRMFTSSNAAFFEVTSGTISSRGVSLYYRKTQDGAVLDNSNVFRIGNLNGGAYAHKVLADFTNPHIIQGIQYNNTRSLSVDGVLVFSGSAPGTSILEQNNLMVGAFFQNQFHMNGEISEIIIYSKKLETLEITQVTNYLSERYSIST